MAEKQVFVSWSRPVSQELANSFCNLIESLPLSVRCWCSQRSSDLPLGPYDHKRIIEAASQSDVCVSILTPENALSPWIFFEAGIFYGAAKNVYGLLCCGVTHQQIKQRNNPIEGFHSYLADQDSFIRLVKSINSACNNIEERRFEVGARAAHAALLTQHNDLAKKFQDPEAVMDASLTKLVGESFKR